MKNKETLDLIIGIGIFLVAIAILVFFAINDWKNFLFFLILFSAAGWIKQKYFRKKS